MYDSEAKAASIEKPVLPTYTVTLALKEIENQFERFDGLIARLYDATTNVLIDVDNDLNVPSPTIAVGETELARALWDKADTLRTLINRLENIVARIQTR